MKQKFSLLLLMSLMTLCMVNAQSVGFNFGSGIHRIPLVKVGFVPLPGNIRPFSLDDSADSMIEVTQSNQEIIVTAQNDLGQVSIEIVSASNVVYSNTMTMIDGEAVCIATDELPSAWYSIYIYIGDTILVGEFEL